jgi:hypothetical protein
MAKITCTNCGAIYQNLMPTLCARCDARLVEHLGDGVPTQGEQYESELSSWRCCCGEPTTPGVMHRTDAPCYYLETTNS